MRLARAFVVIWTALCFGASSALPTTAPELLLPIGDALSVAPERLPLVATEPPAREAESPAGNRALWITAGVLVAAAAVALVFAFVIVPAFAHQTAEGLSDCFQDPECDAGGEDGGGFLAQ
jgi:hypothetical protein